jgi:hypothetical protein
MRIVLEVAAVWFAVSLVAAPIVGRFLALSNSFYSATGGTMYRAIKDWRLPWEDNEQWRVVEQEQLKDLNVRIKYLFRDGTSANVHFPPGNVTEQNIAATGNHLLENPDLRKRT